MTTIKKIIIILLIAVLFLGCSIPLNPKYKQKNRIPYSKRIILK